MRANVARVMGWRDAGEHSRGQGGFFSGVLCRRVSLTPCYHSMIFTFVVPTQQVSCDGTYILEYFYIPRGTEDEFWRGIDQNRQTKFPATAFSDKCHSNSKKVKTKKNKMMGWIENGP
jgi:hypothetical protein